MNCLELRVPPLALFIFCAALIGGAGAYLPSEKVAFPVRRAVAGFAILLGWGVVSAGVFEFRRRKTTMSPFLPERTSSIVSSGIYRWTRNPMYLGMALALFGLTVWQAPLPGSAVVIFFCLYLTRFQIQPEERILLEHFGAEYTQYKAQVRRWI